MGDRCDFEFRMCGESSLLKKLYDGHVRSINKNFLEAVEGFENIAEGGVRPQFSRVLADAGKNQRSIDQAWRSCKGSLYEYAICRALDEILTGDTSLAQRIDIIHGSKLSVYKKQLVIRNWSDILPDADFAIINKKCGKVVAVLSCKTSLRERLTETAFWARELKPKGIDVIFITTDKDEEITAEVNRYIVMHVLDYTVITDPQRYNKIVYEWRRSYGNKPDFNIKINKLLKFIDIIPLLQQYAIKCEGG
jgi:hypothetical protein